MIIDAQHYKHTLANFATGITVITTTYDNHNYGMTANSFNSVSLDPPLILFSVGKNSRIFPIFKEVDSFAISILAENQTNISQIFTRPMEVNWGEVDFFLGAETNNPIINHALSFLEGKKEQEIDAGDHITVILRVINTGIINETGKPLVYFRKNYHLLS